MAQSSGYQKSLASSEWRELIEPFADIGERLLMMLPDDADAQERYELYELAFSAMSAGYFGEFLANDDNPGFWPDFGQAFNIIGPNPDDSYYLSPLSGAGIYRLSGFRGTVRIVDFQIGSGTLYPNGVGSVGVVHANYDIDTLNIGQDGAFEVIVSSKRPSGHTGNWWHLDPSSTYVMIRQRAYDWAGEIDARIAIENVDMPPTKARRTAEQNAALMRKLAMWAENWPTFAMNRVSTFRNQGLVNNGVVRNLAGDGGIGTQSYLEGLFEMGRDEALIYESDVPNPCRYWNVQLTDYLMRATDHSLLRQSSLNGLTVKIDADGKFRAVISAVDPGVSNWLDSAGFRRGYIVA